MRAWVVEVLMFGKWEPWGVFPTRAMARDCVKLWRLSPGGFRIKSYRRED